MIKRATIVLGGLILAAFSIYLVFHYLPFAFISGEELLNESSCKDKKMAQAETINGELMRKIQDNRSHMWKTIEYRGANGLQQSLIFRNEMSNIYDSLSVGDSILKESGDLKLRVIRKGIQKMYQLKYNCK